MLELPLLKRRDALADMMERISKPSPEIQLSQAVATPAADMIRAVGYLGLEGVVAKRRESVYEPGRLSGAWLKYKINNGQEFVIVALANLQNSFVSIDNPSHCFSHRGGHARHDF